MTAISRHGTVNKSAVLVQIEDSLNREIGYRIRDARVMAGVRLEALAADLGVTSAVLTGVERGKSPAKASVLTMIAQRLNTPLSYFLDGVGAGVMQSAARYVDDDQDGKHLASALETARAILRIKDDTLRMMLKRLILQMAQSFETMESKDSPQ